jgi:iron complex outermembrane recepter protein
MTKSRTCDKSRTGELLLSLGAALALAASATSHAQAQTPAPQPASTPQKPASAVALEEIVVTAQRRAESLQKVPIAVSAFTASELERLNVVQALDVMQYVPNVVSSNNVGLGTANTYFIRGLGSTDSIATADPAVGTYVDDIYVARQSANNISLFDVGRIEVLRGPQGTLFGRNTTGGAVNILMAKPGDELGGYVELGGGAFDRRAARGSVDLPLGDKASLKLTGYWNKDDGYAKNVTTGETLNNTDAFGGRIALRADLADWLNWNVSALYTDTEAANIVNFSCNPRAASQCDDRFVSTGLRQNNGGANQFVGATATVTLANGKSNLPLGSQTRLGLVSSNLSFDLGWANLAAITGYVRTEQDFLVDFFDGRAAPTLNFGLDPITGRPSRNNVANNVILNPPVAGLAVGGFVITNIAETDQWTQEFKLTGEAFDGAVSYVAGAFYFNEESTTDFADTLGSVTTRNATLLADRIVRNKTEAAAVYGQADWSFTEKWKATFGVRFTNEQRRTDFSDNRAICLATPLPATCLDSRNFASVDVDLNPATPNVTIPLDQEINIWTPRFALNHQVNDDVLLFASATRGFKSGAQAARATAVRQLLPVGPETVWSYEAGMKSQWLNNRLRLNLTAFVQETKDFQAGTAFVNPTTGALSFVTRNLADLKNQGLEYELVFKPVTPLTLSLTGGFQDMTYELPSGKPAIDSFGFLSPQAQLAECRAALNGLASPLGFAGTAVARAQGNCSGIVTNAGELAKPVRAPYITTAFSAAWEFNVPALDATLTPTLSLLYTSDQEVGTNNLSGWISPSGVPNIGRDGAFVVGSYSEAHTVMNFNLRFATNDDAWQATLSCNNCTDESWPQSTLSNYSYLNEPQTWAIDIRRRF